MCRSHSYTAVFTTEKINISYQAGIDSHRFCDQFTLERYKINFTKTEIQNNLY